MLMIYINLIFMSVYYSQLIINKDSYNFHENLWNYKKKSIMIKNSDFKSFFGNFYFRVKQYPNIYSIEIMLI